MLKRAFWMTVGMLMAISSAMAGVNGKDAYGNGVTVTAMAYDGSATSITTSTTQVVSTTALNPTGLVSNSAYTYRMVEGYCEYTSSCVTVSGAESAGPINVTSATGFPMPGGMIKTFPIAPSTTIACVADTTAGKCKFTPMKR